jgi:hypothetical protein
VADFDWSSLLPFGFLMFGGALLGFTRRKAGRSLARREYPKLATRFGLAHEARPGEVGTLEGRLDGVRVRAESEGRARLVCFPPQRLSVDVRNYEHHKRTPSGFESFSFQNLADDRWAKNRFISEGVAPEPWIEATRRILSAIGADRDRLEAFTVDADKVECVFNFGSPPYLPARVVERVLPAMVELARLAPTDSTQSTVSAAR